MKIECDDCGESNDPGSSRCAACGSILPVTLAIDTNARLDAVGRRGSADYRQRASSRPSGSPRPVAAGAPKPRARDMPFEVDHWEEDVFTSVADDEVARPETTAGEPAPAVPVGPMAYVPGKGLVPRAVPPQAPARSVAPPRGPARARADALKTTPAAPRRIPRQIPTEERRPPPVLATPQEPTLVALAPNALVADGAVVDVAALGATFDRPVAAPRRSHTATSSKNTEVAIAVPVQSIKLARLDPQGIEAEVRVLELGRFLIGREDGDILLRDRTVSPWHAQISVRRNGVFLRDMRSRNGVFVRATAPAALWDTGLVRVGGQTLRYRDRWDEVPPDQHGTLALGGPPPPRATRVEVLGPGGVTTSVRYVADSLLLGRTRGELRFGDDPALLAEHARFEARDGACTVSCVADAPTFVQIDTEVELLGGAIFLVGDTVFRVDF